MFARRQIDSKQKRAADTDRDAFDGLAGPMDFDKRA